MVDKINRIWDDRENIEPSYDSWEKPRVLELLKLLPGTNCRECGVPTCMAFATRLSEGKAAVEECPRLAGPENAGQLVSLKKMCD